MGSVSRDYVLPKPDQEHDGKRLDFQHDLFKLTLGQKLLRASLPKGLTNVLDIATGTGVWAAEFASRNPSIQVHGFDLFKPNGARAPPNCTFSEADAAHCWGPLRAPGPDNAEDKMFDVIHARMFFVVFTSPDPIEVLRQCFSRLRPGGIVEFQELCYPIRSDEPEGHRDHKALPVEWAKKWMQGADVIGVTHDFAEFKLKDALREVGFEDVHVEDYKWPLGEWMGGCGQGGGDVGESKSRDLVTIGEMYRFNLSMGITGISKSIFVRGLGWTESETEAYCEKVARSFGQGRLYSLIKVVWARKPPA